MSLRKTFKTDKNAEVEGVWQDVAVNDHNGKPVRIKLARMTSTNKRYTKALNAITKPHQSAIQNDALDNELACSTGTICPSPTSLASKATWKRCRSPATTRWHCLPRCPTSMTTGKHAPARQRRSVNPNGKLRRETDAGSDLPA